MTNLEKDAASFVDDLVNEKIEGKSFTKKLDDIMKDPAKVMQPVYDYVEEQLNLGKLAYGEVKASDEDVAIRLETNLINLPFQDAKVISKMMQDQETLPVNVYLVISSPWVNKSSLRIDEVASADDYVGNVANYLDQMNNWVAEHLDMVKENLEKQPEEK
ncbi:hypothetical protein [Lentilactobacillus buchneri]|uniref:Uncharacterized protein n=1 Tax=Lentilactobacillus buchneri DSM 20057 TaxID=1423728 RepID=A0A4R5NRW8_LENBU|nr:hypothetical protein [Lentilactobacillus buchneri]WCJ51063.1 hypothetical protein OKF32_07110 [Lentilactobacillus sp. Egmn17]AEB74370.1 hypothetical protein Lbuc_2127 [Lentilactobacillus buchneri NRRL B-30929]KRK69330.1 hypothetical protein FC79_GL001708 [Lentilactobacillus buchneri DSM 20057]MDS1014564.1 hypothetical protein [Lentilactobacillus buchneri]TDG79865.1 hypothetical protein C5L32_000975 [Lentilactobacillus buchneri]